jgi:hypothetical protein
MLDDYILHRILNHVITHRLANKWPRAPWRHAIIHIPRKRLKDLRIAQIFKK